MSTYNVSGLSRQGASEQQNNDNIYMNGVYMDSFKFNRYEKSITAGDAGLYIVCGSYGSEDIARALLKQIKDNVIITDGMSADEIYVRAMTVISELDRCFAQNARPVLDVGVIAIAEGEARMVSLGNIYIKRISGWDSRDLCTVTTGATLGLGFISSTNIVPVSTKFNDGDNLIMCTGSMVQALSKQAIDSAFCSNSSKDGISNIDAELDKSVAKIPVSLICISKNPDNYIPFQAETQTGNKWLKPIYIIPAAAVLLCAIILSIWGISSSIKKEKFMESIDMSAGISSKEMDELKENRSWETKKQSYKDEITPVFMDNKISVESIEASISNGEYAIVADTPEFGELTFAITGFNNAYTEYMPLIEQIDSFDNDPETQERIDVLAEILYLDYESIKDNLGKVDAIRQQRLAQAPTATANTPKPTEKIVTPKPQITPKPQVTQRPTPRPQITQRPTPRPQITPQPTPRPTVRPTAPPVTPKPKPKNQWVENVSQSDMDAINSGQLKEKY